MIRGLAPIAALLLWAVACVAPLHAEAATAAASPTFGHAIVAQRDGEPRLLVDGKPFFFWGGAFFYERIPASQWRASMLAMRDLGANTLDLYIPWNWHELADGDFDFDGRTDPRRNLREVLRLGRELGFHFIVRPGPVIRNEWRNGGYPAWLLTRPEYDMPLHDVLEGRYPATATLQNAHSDDAAAEWMRNATHLRYASRWLHRALDEFRPYADLVLAVQLDDDQGAYIDNQTYPAPHLQAYLRWLDAQVRDVVGPLTPTFINTYQMRVPSSSPVWTMGNWYQSDAYTIGDHDRTELDFSTLLLTLNRKGPLAQSEFQAGWLAGPEDPQPRPADPRNTRLALDELIALGANGIIDFPMQDTYAEPGWEAPFANAAYRWDAALTLFTSADPYEHALSRTDVPGRFWPTYGVGSFLQRFGPFLATAHRVAPIAIAYGEPDGRGDSMPPDAASGIVARTRTALADCIARGWTCALIDARRLPAHLEQYATIVVPPDVRAAIPDVVRTLQAALGPSSRTRLADSVPNAPGPGTTTLTGPDGTVEIAANFTDAPRSVRFRSGTSTVAPHSDLIRVDDVALRSIGGAANDRRRISSDCGLGGGALLTSETGCTVTVRGGSQPTTERLAPRESLTLPELERRLPDYTDRVGPITVPHNPCAPDTPDRADATVERPADGTERTRLTLQNDRIAVTIDPEAGARSFSLWACDSGLVTHSVMERQRSGRELSANAFDATGAWRDDVAVPLPPSPRDYIAKYTHGYPAGTFNRTYRAEILESGTRARVRLTYTMPDTAPPGVTFERIMTLEPRTSRVAVDERLVFPRGAPAEQRAVVRSSLPALATRPDDAAGTIPLDTLARQTAADVPARTTALGTLRNGFVFTVAWRSGDVEHASWTPYRSTGTLALTLAPGWRRVVYAYAPVADAAAARVFLEAERAWVGANPANAGP